MVLLALGPEPTRRGFIHGGVAGHFLHNIAPSAAMSTSVGAAAALALTALALSPLPGLLLLALLLSLLLFLAMLLRFSYTSVD